MSKLILQLWRVSETVWDLCIPTFDEGGELLVEGFLEDIYNYVSSEVMQGNVTVGQIGNYQQMSEGELRSVNFTDEYLMIDLNGNNTLVRIMKKPIGETFIQRAFWQGSLIEIVETLKSYILNIQNNE